jgi:hypothetical protein
VFLVTANHHGFVRRHLDQMHFSAARRTLHARAPLVSAASLPF